MFPEWGGRTKGKQTGRLEFMVYVPLLLRLVTSLLLFGLLVEWLLLLDEMKEWTQFYYIGPLIALLAVVLGYGVFLPSWWSALLLHGGFSLISMMWLFYGSADPVSWLPTLLSTLQEDFVRVINGRGAVSGELRTLLLFSGLAMLASSLQTLVWARYWGAGLALLTAVLLLLVHWFTGYEVHGALLRAAAEGLLLTMLVNYTRIVRRYGSGRLRQNPVELQRSWPLRWWAASLASAGMLILAGHVMAAEKPRLSQPMFASSELIEHYIQPQLTAWTRQGAQRLGQSSGSMNAGTIHSRMTGYGFDDNQLGAPLTVDDTVVFTGISPARHYWRGETRSEYTGSGWLADRAERSVLLPVEAGAVTTDGDGREISGRITQKVVLAHPAAGLPLFASGNEAEVRTLIAAEPERSVNSYLMNERAGSLHAPGDSLLISSYTVESSVPDRASLVDRYEFDELRDIEASLTSYLQLPDLMPQRVADLAVQVTAEAAGNRYAMVMALESYLRSEYAYSTADSRQPAKGKDFVEHFLFEQRQGYCVHFSTAMVVMLRTLDIPARWVKGFAPGMLSDDGASEQQGQRYIVRNSDAHAWVEVYFPQAGWVPFDPTPGYSGQAAPVLAASTSAADSTLSGAAVGSASFASGALAPLRAGWEAAAALAERATGVGERMAAAAADPAARRWMLLAAAAAALSGAAAAALWRQRARLALRLALRQYRRAYAAGSAARGELLAVAEPCWRLLQQRLGQRLQGETAREYAGKLELQAEAAQLLRWDEQARYGGEWLEPPEPGLLSAAVASLLAARSGSPRR